MRAVAFLDDGTAVVARLSILYLRCPRRRNRLLVAGETWLSILYLRCYKLKQEGRLPPEHELSILYLRCGGRLRPVAVPLPTTFNSLFEMQLRRTVATSPTTVLAFQFSI